MILDATLSVLHFWFVLGLVGTLVAEVVLLRGALDAARCRQIAMVDAFFGLTAGGVLIVGFCRALFGAKGWAYYAHEPFFWVKLGLFALVGLISIPPTLTYLRWRKQANADGAFTPPEAEVKRARRLVVIETHGVALIVVAAALMARGIG